MRMRDRGAASHDDPPLGRMLTRRLAVDTSRGDPGRTFRSPQRMKGGNFALFRVCTRMPCEMFYRTLVSADISLNGE